jgi:uncharacterized membrane protein
MDLNNDKQINEITEMLKNILEQANNKANEKLPVLAEQILFSYKLNAIFSVAITCILMVMLFNYVIKSNNKLKHVIAEATKNNYAIDSEIKACTVFCGLVGYLLLICLATVLIFNVTKLFYAYAAPDLVVIQKVSDFIRTGQIYLCSTL